METTPIPESGPESIYREEMHEGREEAAEGLIVEPVRSESSETQWRYVESEESLINAGFTLELRNVKTAMVIAPNHPIPVAVEGLLLQHHEMPLAAELEVVLSADDREIVRERFFLPTPRRAEIMAAHRELAQMSPEFLTDSRLRDKAMSVYFPELCEEHDAWYRVAIDDNGDLTYAVHVGPSNNQEVKKRVEGRLQL
jgi:hypothetical protein